MSLQNDELKWIAVDLDDTLATNSGYPDFTLLEPVKGARDAMCVLEREGWKITIYTARPSADYDKIETWLNKWEIPHRRIFTGKILARYIIDDRNIEFKGDWNEILHKIPKR